MKRGKPLARRTPLRAKQTWKSKGNATLKRGRRLKAESETHRVERADHPAIRQQVFARDGYRCVLAGMDGAGVCFGILTPHHVRKSGQGGAYTLDNLVTLCAHHNGQLEADADLAALGRELGIVKRRGDG